MFIENHKASIGSNIDLYFLKSIDTAVFPSGRRRNTKIDASGQALEHDNYYIPFDPEARLNTEANNRKHSSINGYTQTYLKDFSNNKLSVVIEGYLFNINFTSQQVDASTIAEEIKADDSVFVNIILEDTPLYSNTGLEYSTKVLRNQSDTDVALDYLDLINLDKVGNSADNLKCYYFSGLSFSSLPLTGGSELPVSRRVNPATHETRQQEIISLKILDKVNGTWQKYQQALLPNIKHGTTENSVILGDTEVNSLVINGDIRQKPDKYSESVSIPSMYIQTNTITSTDESGTTKYSTEYQLCFKNVDIIDITQKDN
jgi:hypothetical protein